MAKLSEVHRLIGNYLELHGDKDITSIASWCGTAPQEYTFNLHDIHKGNIGTNPYTGKDKIDILRGGA